MIGFLRVINNKLGFNKSIGNRKITKARFLYLYVIIGSIAGLCYFIFALFYGLPKQWALSPIYLLASFVVARFLYKNWSLIWMYLTDMERGKLLLFLNEHTHFEEEHKAKLVDWVYLKRRTVRQETKVRILNYLTEGEKLTIAQKKILGYKSVYCPQQVKDGFNEAVLVNALIYADRNIQVIDDELMDIMGLTIDRMIAFDLNKEADKALGSKYDKMIETGKRVSKTLNKD